MLRASPPLLQKWVRIVPHIVDTPSLASAIGLVIWSHQSRLAALLTAKVIALIGYIVLGSIALQRGRTKEQRLAVFLAALELSFYIGMTAVTKRLFPFA